MGFFDALLNSNPLMQKAQVVITAGLLKRRQEACAALCKVMGRTPTAAELDEVLAATSHGTVIREIAKATGVDLLRTLADKLEGKG